MEQQKAPGLNAQNARIVHSAMLASIVAISLGLGVARSVTEVDFDGLVAQAVQIFALVQLVVVGVLVQKLKMAIPLCSAEGDANEWWRANGARVMVTWALSEGTATLGAVAWLLTGEWAALFVIGAALVLLLRLGPNSWHVYS
ncbi:MAG: hypothetical protein OEZ54_03865 [Gemmatimonadota bacterium]|nr:hypothetical protein [Gemmatimonadota bacterium]